MEEIKVPVFPESVSEGTLISWQKKVGDTISADDVLAEIETDKVVFEVPAPTAGTLKEIVVEEGSDVRSEQLIGRVDTTEIATDAPATAPPANGAPAVAPQTSPAVRKMLDENKLSTGDVLGSGKNRRITKADVEKRLTVVPGAEAPALREQRRVPMTRIRSRIAERLLQAKQTTAMLTTFNEVNMQAITDLRQRYKEAFEKQHQLRLGFMSFFVKACCDSLLRFPDVNAFVDGSDLVYHNYCDVGVAVSTDRGLVVPILRSAEQMSVAEVERQVRDFGVRGRDGKLTIEEMTGGTFSITNGGVFGSLLSTPILNTPQSAILGMHNIVRRPVAEGDQVVIRPMMYIALSYDHRVIDGKSAVSFLRTVKEKLEDPARILLDL